MLLQLGLPEREIVLKARGVLWGYLCWDLEVLGGGGSYQQFFDLLKWPEV